MGRGVPVQWAGLLALRLSKSHRPVVTSHQPPAQPCMSLTQPPEPCWHQF